MVEDVNLRAIYEELKVIRDVIKKLTDKIEFIELALIGEEEISMEDAEELDKLAKETREKGVEWEKFKARLDL
ncbi:MAG: hypothetical protein L6N96_05705 [Candidatus Methylarchaceae archaeon HK02M2]|nr:hypothetical protein [Candidatus Methylarchaceae archaeon HK02M2]